MIDIFLWLVVLYFVDCYLCFYDLGLCYCCELFVVFVIDLLLVVFGFGCSYVFFVDC